MVKAIAILVALLDIAASAASLSLSSTNDYIYISMPTNGTVDIRGLGAGPEGLYSMPRREDWMFLAEAMSERRAVASALCNDAALIGTNKYWAVTPEYYSHLPSTHQQYYFWPQDVMWTNGSLPKVTMPIRFVSSPVWADTIRPADNILDAVVDPRMIFDGKSMPVSMQTVDALSRYRHYASPAFGMFGQGMPVLAMITNSYVDIINNTCPIFKQHVRTGTVSERTITRTYSPRRRPSYYDFAQDQWIYNDVADEVVTVTNSSAYSAVNFTFNEYRTVTASSLSAIKKNVGTIARTRILTSDYYQTRHNGSGRITLPIFAQGTSLIGISRAFAVVTFDHMISSGTNQYYSLSKTLYLPTRMIADGSTTEGYPVYVEHNGITPSDVHEACCRILDQTLSDDEYLLSLVGYPEYPTEDADRDKTLRSSNSITDQIVTSIVYYIGGADVTFRARVL